MKNRRRTSHFSNTRKRAATAVVVFLASILGSCVGTRGPVLVVNSHIDYNKAVSQVLKEELLLNIV